MKIDGKVGYQDTNANKYQAVLLNPKSGELLAQISLDEEHTEVNQAISNSGSLQGFTILSGKTKLHETWFNQKNILLRIGNVHHLVKIVTFPIDGEKTAHLEIIQGNRKDYYPSKGQHQPNHLIQRGRALFQAIIGT